MPARTPRAVFNAPMPHLMIVTQILQQVNRPWKPRCSSTLSPIHRTQLSAISSPISIPVGNLDHLFRPPFFFTLDTGSCTTPFVPLEVVQYQQDLLSTLSSITSTSFLVRRPSILTYKKSKRDTNAILPAPLSSPAYNSSLSKNIVYIHPMLDPIQTSWFPY
jgi:hypothetical protein